MFGPVFQGICSVALACHSNPINGPPGRSGLRTPVGTTGYVTDTIGDFFGGPGIGPGEPFNMQLAAKIIF